MWSWPLAVELNPGLGQDDVHRDVVGLGKDRGKARGLQANADGERARRQRSKCPVKVAPAIAQPKARPVPSDKRGKGDIRYKRLGIVRRLLPRRIFMII